MKRLQTIILFALCGVLLASCDYRVVRDPRTLVESIPVDPATLNPALASDIASYMVCDHLYDSLLQYDNRTLRLKPMLAKEWEVSPDHLSYTLRLRDDVLWHDGRPFTADDVIFTFDAVRNPKVDALLARNYFRDLVRVEKLGSDAVRFVYSKPYFKALSTIGQMKIIPKHVFEDLEGFNENPSNRRPVGTGPFRFVEWRSGRMIRISRFDGYYGERSAIDGIVYMVVPNRITAFQLLKKGAIDFGEITPTQWTFQTEAGSFKEKFTKHHLYPPNYTFIGWNMRTPYFSDRRVRLAMTMLVNREEILKKALFGQGKEVVGPFYRFGINYDESIRPYPYDPDAARKLLDEAGWIDADGDGVREKDGVPFEFTLLFRAGDSFSRSLGLFLEEELQRVGVRMKLMQLEWASMIGKVMKREFDAASLAFALPVEEDPYGVWHSSTAEIGSNFVEFNNVRADEILTTARLEFDPMRRAGLYRELQAIIYEEQPFTFLFTLPTLLAVARRFENVTDYRTTVDPLEWKVAPWPVLTEW